MVDTTATLVTEARKLLQQGKPALALQLLLEAEPHIAAHAEVQFLIARCYYSVGKQQEAFRALSQLQAAHGQGPWSLMLEEIYGGNSPVAPAPPMVASVKGRPDVAPRRVIAIAVACAVSVCAIAAMAYFALQRRAPEQTAPVVVTAMGRPLIAREVIARLSDPNGLRAAYFALAEGLSTADVPVLRQALRECKYAEGRLVAARMLGAIGSADAEPELAEAASADASANVRQVALWALGKTKGEIARQRLPGLLSSATSKHNRQMAARAFFEVSGVAAASAIEQQARQQQSSLNKFLLRNITDGNSKGNRPPIVMPREVSTGVCSDTTYSVYTPISYKVATPSKLMVAMHAEWGTQDSMVEALAPIADKAGCVLLAPLIRFDEFPYYAELNLELGQPAADTRLLDIIEQLRQVISLDLARFTLIGFGAGADFSIHFAFAYPERVEKLALYAGVHYVSANPSVMFPLGPRPHPFRPDISTLDFGKLIGIPTAILLSNGEEDGVRNGANAYYEAAETYAREHNLRSAVSIIGMHKARLSARKAFPLFESFLLGSSGE